ncbi:MAG: DUF3368 domain-containing protein [Phycisphaeraceae bacterium]
MLVVADSSPIHYLVLIHQSDLFRKLFGRVVIPEQVASELSHMNAPQSVQDFMAHRPDWFKVQSPRIIERIPAIDAGEEAAICLAKEIEADLLLIDDLDGRWAAKRFGLQIIGTLGVLELASGRGLIDLPAVVKSLQATNMRLSDRLIEAVLGRDEKRGQSDGEAS